jgi:hypothetical protein
VAKDTKVLSTRWWLDKNGRWSRHYGSAGAYVYRRGLRAYEGMVLSRADGVLHTVEAKSAAKARAAVDAWMRENL